MISTNKRKEVWVVNHITKGTLIDSSGLRALSASSFTAGIVKVASTPPGPPSAFASTLPLVKVDTSATRLVREFRKSNIEEGPGQAHVPFGTTKRRVTVGLSKREIYEGSLARNVKDTRGELHNTSRRDL
jgi:hypothetical protein